MSIQKIFVAGSLLVAVGMIAFVSSFDGTVLGVNSAQADFCSDMYNYYVRDSGECKTSCREHAGDVGACYDDCVDAYDTVCNMLAQ